jgi:hypothetical protein
MDRLECEISGTHSGVAEDSSVVGCEGLPLDG